MESVSRECPGLLIQVPEGGFPEIKAGMDEACVECGHCVAVCPHGALSHKKIRIENSPEILEELKISMRQAEQFLRSRRSIRVYQAKPVEQTTIRRLIEVARCAPTAGNSQLVEWLVLTDRSQNQKDSRAHRRFCASNDERSESGRRQLHICR